ncbi:unnamed protein product [Ectocarpus sp. 12 AP-2014]
MKTLADEVLRLGHRRIAVISGIIDGNDRARQRLEGVKDAVLEAGLDPAKLRIVETLYEIESGAAAFEKLLSQPERPSVVICGNDVLGVGALGQAREMGMDVPGDVSITGFDDIELAKVATPALATVQVPHGKMGRTAARVLIDMIENQSVVPSVELATELKLRASLGPVPSE